MSDSRTKPIPSAAPELLAPAGDFDCAKAAVENGADAVYFGLQTGFNARARATNVPPDRLAELMTFLRRRGVKGYLTVNTLALPGELEEVQQILRLAVPAGVDAVLVQDFGVARLVQTICPELAIHASTQMSLTSTESVRVAEQLGIRRVVLARELSVAQIAEIRRQTEIELEVFVHGALCVSYSGQCLTSLSLGGRSANRGQCAQACRMPYELICDGTAVELGGRRYLLSPQDLAAYDLVPELIEAGVSGLKIEGRLKTAEYVANVTRHYRQAIDMAMAGQSVRLSPRQSEELGLSFSRGFCHGWLEGSNPKSLVPGESSANRGVYLGRVTAVRRGRVEVELAGSIKRGDGIAFEEEGPESDEQGCRVYEVFLDDQSLVEPVAQGRVELTFGRGAVEFGRLRPGQRVWKTDDPELTRRLRKSYEGQRHGRRVALDLVVEAAVEKPLRIRGRAASGATCQLQSPAPLVEAQRHPLTPEVLRQQLGRLGGTVYELRSLEANVDGRPMIPLSVLGTLRRAMVEQLDASVAEPRRRAVAEEEGRGEGEEYGIRNTEYGRQNWEGEVASGSSGLEAGGRGKQEARLYVLCRSLVQLKAALDCQVSGVIADFQELGRYAEAVPMARAAGKTILLATPRIQKPGEMDLLTALVDHQADGVLARNLAALALLGNRGILVVADFSLNAANPWAAQWLLGQGATRVTASYDLERARLVELAGTLPPDRLEVVVHQHMPMFHMEYCLFCALLSPGTDRASCERPCIRHEVRLRDRVGAEHLLRADAGCRNTLYNALPQSAAEAVPALLKQGVGHFRVELLEDVPAEELAALVGVYQRLLASSISGKEAWEQLKSLRPSGITRGALDAT